MKKTVVLILIFLPIVLLFVIAIAGRVLSTYQRIDVERVVFVDDAGNEMSDYEAITLNVGETKSTNIKIYPELATDKRVSYISSAESICTVDENGTISGISGGHADIMVKTADGDRTAWLTVIVRSEKVTGVTLSRDTLSMMLGESKNLAASVEPHTASNKKVTYETSDPSIVTVDALGKVKAVGAGTATVTVTTDDGGFTDTCLITVVNDTSPLTFEFDGVAGMMATGEGYISSQSTVNLLAGIRINGEIELSAVKFSVVQTKLATIDENGILTFDHGGVIVTVKAFVGDENNPTYSAEATIAWFGEN